jgi:putative hydrolase of the HAD superfamily
MKQIDNRIKVLMLDLGYVLIELTLDRFNRAVEEKLGKIPEIANYNFHHRYMAGDYKEADFIRELERRFGLKLSPSEFPDFWSLMLGEDRAELLRPLEKIRKKMKTAICSNTDATHIEFLKRRGSPMIEGFDYYCYSFDLRAVKPERQYFEKALKIIGYPPEACLFLDDNAENIRAAGEMGILTKHVPAREDVLSALNELVLLLY